ncbi:FAD-binding domain-containing protein [Xylaria sp. FL0043]|nr:FAD-binding domain-containing protein [Xylaria sp. FL0043]
MDIHQAVTAIQELFPSEQVLLPSGPTADAYKARNGSYLANQLNEITPTCIFQPKDTEDVSKFIRLISPYVAGGAVRFAIRGAGNMPLSGCSNIQNGITLDPKLLEQIELTETMVSVGAGALWLDVDKIVQSAGLGVVGGRSGTGGIGGLALSGGLSIFSSREGCICDNIADFEVVLNSGEVVHANANENSDLWVALKGGSNNFGVVTRFTMRTFKLGHFWGGNVLYPPPTFPSQIEALVAELKRPRADTNTHIMISIGFSAKMGGASLCLNTVYYTKDVENPAALAPFTAIESQIKQPGQPKRLNLTQMAGQQAAGVSNQSRCVYMNLTVKADVATLQTAVDVYTEAIVPVKPCKGITCSLTFQPYPVSLLQQSVVKGDNSLGLDPSVPAISVLLLTYWDEKSDDELITGTMRSALESIRERTTQMGTALDYVYLGYAADFQDPISSYGSANKKGLQDISRKYDPSGLFQKGVPGGFKLF